MTYRITGLDPEPYAALFKLTDEQLAARGALRMDVTECPGSPCRVTLADAPVGSRVVLVNHVSHDVANPYRASHAIFVAEGAGPAADYRDRIPAALDTRTLSLRAFDRAGMMAAAALAEPGAADAAIRRLFADPAIAYIHAHNANRGCFAARVERSA